MCEICRFPVGSSTLGQRKITNGREEVMGKLVVTEYISMDGVFEEPGHWSFPFLQ